MYVYTHSTHIHCVSRRTCSMFSSTHCFCLKQVWWRTEPLVSVTTSLTLTFLLPVSPPLTFWLHMLCWGIMPAAWFSWMRSSYCLSSFVWGQCFENDRVTSWKIFRFNFTCRSTSEVSFFIFITIFHFHLLSIQILHLF